MKKSTNQILKETVVALGGTIDENDVSTGDAYKKLAVTLGGEVSEDGSSLDALTSIGKALPEAAGGSGGGGLTNLSINNPNYPNCYIGQVINLKTKIRIDFVKYMAAREAFYASGVPYSWSHSFDDAIYNAGDGSGSASSGLILHDILFMLLSYRSSAYNSGGYDCKIRVNGATLSIGASSHTPYEISSNGSTIRELLTNVGVFEFSLEEILERTNAIPEPEDMEYMVVHINNSNITTRDFYEIGSSSTQWCLNDYPVDWLEFINE